MKYLATFLRIILLVVAFAVLHTVGNNVLANEDDNLVAIIVIIVASSYVACAATLAMSYNLWSEFYGN